MIPKTKSSLGFIGSAGVLVRYLGWTPKGSDKLDLARFSWLQISIQQWQGACRSVAPRVRNELKSALVIGKSNNQPDFVKND
ncbi:hypothetical protein TNCV_397081 [Trichonephila clavipes]|nr:hypothetical protein TNCV_397081 [Trichonephila clavipes]